MKKVLLIGSGGLKIGQAGEFDYSGSQAIKALKEEGIEVIVLNPNIATIQTDPQLADRIYFLPINPFFAERVIKKERPQGLLLGFGGQTALNLGVELDQRGILKKYRVVVLGTSVEAIRDTEDRKRFSAKLREINIQTSKGKAVRTIAEAIAVAKKLGYPLMIRSAYSLGGENSGMVKNAAQLKKKVHDGLKHSPGLIVEEYLWGWKEIEYEVMRDRYDNCVTVCNMENVDPMGVHTGESIVVAPSQTLNNEEYHRLRDISIRVIRHIGIIGECNIQFALHPKTREYRVIEVNARLSRSSALASKATGYPLAFIATKLALGYGLFELKNSMTKVTTALFEPALDYIVMKMPRWDLAKFPNADRRIGTEMKSVGEVMAIGRSFEEVLQKSIRMLGIGALGFIGNGSQFKVTNEEKEMREPTDKRIFAIGQALLRGVSVRRIHRLSGIDCWFLERMKHIVDCKRQIATEPLTPEILSLAKQNGFSDQQIGACTDKTAEDIRLVRLRHHIVPVVKQIDTLAGEFPTTTNYLYMTYHGTMNDVAPERHGIMVLGSGPYSIGSSVEFDWSSMQAVKTLKKLKKKSVMVNCNPETVSTDYDEVDRLYFEELTLERVMDIYEFERPKAVIISVGGQIPNTLGTRLSAKRVRILGTRPADIDRAEDRHKFSLLLDRLGIQQPPWSTVPNEAHAVEAANAFGYPVIVRPSYVLSGTAMNVVFTDEELRACLSHASRISAEHPVVVSKFIEHAREVEVDGVANHGVMVISALTEHVENAGVHSGDATVVIPTRHISKDFEQRIYDDTVAIVSALKITGPFNIQFLIKDEKIMVIECNLRASRSFPFVSKATKRNFIDCAVRVMLLKREPRRAPFIKPKMIFVKSPQFSYHRLKGVDPLGYVEMASTGEVACMADNFEAALLLAMISSGFRLPKKHILLSLGKEYNKKTLLNGIKNVATMGLKISATEHTAEFLWEHGVTCQKVYKIRRQRSPNVRELLEKNAVDLIINIPANYLTREANDGYGIRRMAVDYDIPLISNLEIAHAFLNAFFKIKKEARLPVLAYHEIL